MSSLGYLVAAVFLPLFPFSMLFNRLFARVENTRLRMGLLLLWPQPGILALAAVGASPPVWLAWWGLATAGLYALRTAALRDLRLWTGLMATSAWALLWPLSVAAGGAAPGLQALGLSAPLVLLAWLAGRLKTGLGAAFAGVGGGLAGSLPRLSGLLTLAMLAAVGTPPAPGFFSLLGTAVRALPAMPGVALAVLGVWLLWAWSGVRILRGFIVGPACAEPPPDLGAAATALVGLALAVLLLAGPGLSGELP